MENKIEKIEHEVKSTKTNMERLNKTSNSGKSEQNLVDKERLVNIIVINVEESSKLQKGRNTKR